MAVNSEHKEYQRHKGRWRKVRDCVEGEDAIKDAGTTYLPKPLGWSREAYEQYLSRARFSNFTGRTAEALHGSVFSRLSAQSNDLSESFGDFLGNIDNAGASIYEFAAEFCRDVLQTGWGGILADHPPTPEGISRADVDRLELKSYLKWYAAENVINWQHGTEGGRTFLSLVVLQETFVDGGDEFAPTVKTRYRVLRLTDGVYTQQVYTPNEGGDGDDEFILDEIVTPEMGGEPFRFIPFFPVSSRGPEKSILLDLANENLGHYQDMADLNNSLHMFGIATPWASTKDIPIDKKTGEPKIAPLGGGTFIWYGENTTTGYLEPSGNGIAHSQRKIDASEQRMRILGAKPLEAGTKGVEAAATARIHAAAANSVLGSFAVNMAGTITQAARLGARWRGVPDAEAETWEFSLNTNYDGDLAETEKRKLALEQVDNGTMSKHRFLVDIDGMRPADAAEEIRRLRAEGSMSYEGEQ